MTDTASIYEPDLDMQCGFHLYRSFKDIILGSGLNFRNFGPLANYQPASFGREILGSDAVILTKNIQVLGLENLFGSIGGFVAQYLYERGGTLVVLFHPGSPQDVGPWGPFLSQFKIHTTNTRLYLRDARGRTSDIVRFSREESCLSDHSLLEGVEELVIDHPYCINSSPPQVPLVWGASGMRTIDWTRDLEDDFPTGRDATLMSVWENIGSKGGRFLLLAYGCLDDGLIDSEEGNLQFCENVARWITARTGIAAQVSKSDPVSIEGEQIASLLTDFPAERSAIEGALAAYAARSPDFGRQALGSLRTALENLTKRLSDDADWQAGLDRLISSDARKKTVKAAHVFLSAFGTHGVSAPAESDVEHGFRMAFSAIRYLLSQGHVSSNGPP